MIILADIDYFTFAFCSILCAIFAASRYQNFRSYLAERKRRAEFAKFEAILSGVNPDYAAAQKYFSGEIRLTEEVNVFVPELLPIEDHQRFQNSIDAELKRLEIGHVIRGFETDESCGIDIYLSDFVQGVDLIRRQLPEQGAPAGTLIEYSGGDLMVYDD